MSLSTEDVALMDQCFPAPEQVALLIRPYATKVSTAGFFFREDGAFQETTPLEFPFRRRELTGEEPPARRTSEQRGLERRPLGMRAGRPVALRMDAEEQYSAPPRPSRELRRLAAPAYSAPAPAPSRLRSVIWVPLSFVFLLFGLALGLMIGVTRWPGHGEAGEFALGLAVAKVDQVPEQSKESGYNLSVKWNRTASAVRTAQRGVLDIEDGKYTKSVDLDTAQLSNGGIVYRNSSGTVRFRLTVYPRSRVSVTETAEWRQ
jgi:hypothetical protein